MSMGKIEVCFCSGCLEMKRSFLMLGDEAFALDAWRKSRSFLMLDESFVLEVWRRVVDS